MSAPADPIDVLAIYAEADAHSEIHWRVEGRRVRFVAFCSDFFAWGTADGEPIETAEDVALLRQCLTDLQAIERTTEDKASDASVATAFLSELYAARRRKMRPMRLVLGPPFSYHKRPKDTKPAGMGPGPLQDLFVACGPDRDPVTEG